MVGKYLNSHIVLLVHYKSYVRVLTLSALAKCYDLCSCWQTNIFRSFFFLNLVARKPIHLKE